MVVHVYNPSSSEAEVKRSQSEANMGKNVTPYQKLKAQKAECS
jgi:hypothetical protein